MTNNSQPKNCKLYLKSFLKIILIVLVGETTNLMSIDTQKFQDLMLYLNMAWSSPLQIALAMFFLWQVLGPSSMAGISLKSQTIRSINKTRFMLIIKVLQSWF